MVEDVNNTFLAQSHDRCAKRKKQANETEDDLLRFTERTATARRRLPTYRAWKFFRLFSLIVSFYLQLVTADDSSNVMIPKEILLSFYESTGGPSWKIQDNWNSNTPICDWHGIVCDQHSEKVLQINLNRNNLNGSIPPSLWKLPHLQQVHLQGNLLTSLSLTGLLTSDLEKDPRSPLETLVVADNHLGDVNGIGNAFATLKHLNVNRNNIVINILDQIDTAVQLETLHMAFNQIRGSIPGAIGRLTNLKEFYAFDNRLTGTIPSEMGLLDLVGVVGLGNNLFTGTLPTEMEQMVNLKDLSIHHVVNQADTTRNATSHGEGLTGRLLTFGDMPYLSLLFLDGNSLTGTIPSDFLRHNTLTDTPISVGLTNNQLSGTIPASLERFEALSIDLVGNNISKIPEELCHKGGWMGGLVEEFKCDAILCAPGTYNVLGRAFGSENPCLPCDSKTSPPDLLGLTACQGDDESAPDDEGNSSAETWLLLAKFHLAMGGDKWTIRDGWNALDGFISGTTDMNELDVEELNICQGWYGILCNSDDQVTDISLPNNGLYGTVPDYIFWIPTLQSFDISNNNLQLENLDGVSQAQGLTSMALSNVKIKSLKGIGGLTGLRQLLLDGLSIAAPIATELFDLTNLRTLHLQHGHFNASIPTQIGKLSELEDLNMYGNKLSGALPTEIGALTRLRALDLSENEFTGTIPADIRSLVELERFAIHQVDGISNLEGTLPPFDTFPRLKEVSLEYNAFTGSIPNNFLARIADKFSEITISLGFNRIEGDIPESLNAFDKLVLNLEGNRITGIPDVLCDKSNWMQGEVGQIKNATEQCNAILCPPSTWNEFGKEADDLPCLPCEALPSSPSDQWAFWYGRISCGDLSPSREKEILDKLFAATGGRYWTSAHDNWLKPGVPICQREGVQCGKDYANEGILELRMLQFGLRGTIPPEIWELTNARDLTFTRNDVDVSFEGIEKAESLHTLKLSRCHLRTLEGLGKVSPRLAELHLAENQFNGTIPDDIFELSQVKWIFLNRNHFSGGIPSALARLTSATKIELFENDFTGTIPTEIGLLTDLTELQVQLNQLSGTIPNELLSLKKLSTLDISQQSGKKFWGAFPTFEQSPALTYIDASGNSFSGALPANLLAQVDPSVEVNVNLAANRFEGAIPAEWTRFAALNLELGGNRLTALPESLCQKNEWQKGQVGLFSTCDAILCPPGEQAPTGRQVEVTESCMPCTAGETSAPFYGTLKCLDPRSVEEKRILSDLYDNANGTNWLMQTNWLSDGSVCDWYGVLCDENGHVSEIKLDNNMLEAPLTSRDILAELFKLEDLTVLDLKGNNLELNFARLPEGTKLEFLRMSATGMTSISGISKGTSLKAFHATNNELRFVPEELFSMTSLESLFLSYNSITGTISRHFGQMSNLKELYMFGNRLTGFIPAELGRLPHLSVLVLSQNYLSGNLPESLSSLPELEQCSVADQRGIELITGPVPSFSKAPNLRYFDASNNDLTGPIPDSFMMRGLANSSIAVYLQSNEITGTVPLELNRFDSLDINLADNKIIYIPPELCQNGMWMDGVAAEIGSCSAILCPSETFNQFGRESPGNACLPCDNLVGDPFLGHTHCENFTSERDTLRKVFEQTGGPFWVNASDWNSEAPICSWEGISCDDGDLQDAEGITALRLDGNGLSGALPTEVWTLPALRYLSLKKNPKLRIDFNGLDNAAETLQVLFLSETGLVSLEGISAASSLTELHLTGNKIKGTFPDELFALSNTLETLYIADNLFYGSLPTELGRMTNLRAFYAFENDFLSMIPSELGRLKYLQVLVLAENMLYDQIPQELSSMPALELFAAFRRNKSGPRLSGTLPSFDKLPQLTDIYLQGNDIGGSIPDNFVSASRSVGVIRLSNNVLTGNVPENLGSVPRLSLELEGNRIEGFPDSFCSNRDWMDGAIELYGCEAFLCPPGTASPNGRVDGDSSSCQPCTKVGAAKHHGSTSCDGSLSEREILVNLFYALNGRMWHRNDFWGSTADVCDWYGIGCVEGHVAIINLRGNNLRGQPGPDLFFLPELKTLWFYSNPVEFSFENIGSAKKLQDLRLDSTILHSLRGIGAAMSLISFDASFTALRGAFPEQEILALTNLRSLHLNDNDFTGTLPKSFAPIKYLVNLRLGSNRLSGGLPSFDDMSFLEYIDISSNRLSGQISRKIFSGLGSDDKPTLRLAHNQLTGVVPQELDRFQDMSVYLSGNEILGLPVVLCDNVKWNNAEVGKYGCDAILCKPGSSSTNGRRTPDEKCLPCKGAIYFGDTSCPTQPSSSSGRYNLIPSILAVFLVRAMQS